MSFFSAAALKKYASEPFRAFFPLGVFCALLGVLYWPITIYQLGFFNFSADFHVWMQIYGFLGAFVFGFLGTAVPRLTQAPTLREGELFALFCLHSILILMLLFGQFIGTHVVFFIECVIFIFILAQRFLKRRRSP